MGRARILLAIALILFTGLSTYQLTLPGLHYDEAFEAVPAMQLLLGQRVMAFRDSGILIGGRLLPLMTQDYIGAINTYLLLPFFVLLGTTLFSLRLMSVVMGLLTICLAYRLADELYNPRIAGLAALLLAVSPTFIFWNRQGVFVTSVTAAVGLATTLFWLRWWRTGARRYAIAGSFLFGLGVYAKFLFVWLIFALGLAAFVLNLGRLGEIRKRISGLLLGWCALAFLLGAAPLIIYNLQTGGTLSSIMSNLTVSYYGTNNLAFMPNLLQRITQFASVLSGGHFWYLGETYANWLGPVAFLVALGGVLWGARIAIVKPEQNVRADVRRAVFPFVIIAGVILASCATVSALWVTHFAIVAPWPTLALAGAVGLLLKRFRRPITVGLTLALVGALWVGDVYTDVRYHQALATSGGLGAHSDAVYDLAHWLTAHEREGAPVVAMDWGIAATVTFLTQGEVTPVEAFGYDWETDTDFEGRLSRFVQDPDTIYLWRAPDEIVFDRAPDFQRLYTPLGLEEDILEAFYERSGRPVLGATRLVPQGAATNPPQPR